MFQSAEDISKALSCQSIEQVGMNFFGSLGHTSLTTEPICCSSDVLNFMYSDLSVKKILTPSDRSVLKKVKRISYLFRKDNVDFTQKGQDYIQYFSAIIEDDCTDRSQMAYAIHQVLGKANPFYSVILFQHCGKYLLSFHYWSTENKNNIVLSDWFDEFKEEDYFDAISAYNFSTYRAMDFFFDFIYSAARDYYIHPLAKEYIRLIVLPSLFVDDGDMQFLPKTELAEEVAKIDNEPIFEYGDDYVQPDFDENAEDSVDDPAVEVDFDLVEYELEHMGVFDDELSDEDVDEEERMLGKAASTPTSGYDASTISPDILKDPVELLEWINKNEKSGSNKDNIPTTTPQSTDDIDEDSLLEKIAAEGLDYVDNRSKGGVLWLLGGKELTAFLNSISSITRVFTFKPSGGKATNGEDGWWLK